MKNSYQEPPLEDIVDLPEVPDGGLDGWDHLQLTGSCLNLPKMYNTWGVK